MAVKRIVWNLAIFSLLLSTLSLVACHQSLSSSQNDAQATSSRDNSPIAPSPTLEPSTSATQSPQAATFTVDEFTVDEFTLDEITGQGCGMALWHPNRQTRDRFLFFSGLDTASMEMKLDGEIVQFRRTAARGTEFYGQKTFQAFISEDGDTKVSVEVELGRPGEIESVAIDAGILRVKQGEAAIELSVVGDAGC